MFVANIYFTVPFNQIGKNPFANSSFCLSNNGYTTEKV